MNRIGILTYHACNNYGASLQAFALQTTVRERCGDCEIIHYRSDIMREITRPFTKRPRHPKELAKNVTRLPYRAALERRDRLFEEFTNEVLRVGPLCKTREEVIAQAERYDCIICGSDQIWNLDPGIRYQTPLFFLNFPKKQRRVAYAPSFSNWVKDAPTQEDVFLPWLRTFDALSVREESGAEYLRGLGLPCEVVLDPTLLLDRPAYDAIARTPRLDHPYILLFSWTMSREVCQAARRISAALGRKIVSIVPPPRALFGGFPRLLDVGPREFLGLVQNADFVVTNSFHGTVFSSLYEKPFVSVCGDRPDTRLQSALHRIGLDDHLCRPDEIDLQKLTEYDFRPAKQALQTARAASLSYLDAALAPLTGETAHA